MSSLKMTEKANNIVVIENGILKNYRLDDKNVWEVGRATKINIPDIPLMSSTVSRQHGKFKNTEGVWFYIDINKKNGTIHNCKKIEKGFRGLDKPVMLRDGDIFLMGGGEEPVIDSKTVWMIFLEQLFVDGFTVIDTHKMTKISFICGENENTFINPSKGLVIKNEDGIAIYMGDISFVAGNMQIVMK